MFTSQVLAVFIAAAAVPLAAASPTNNTVDHAAQSDFWAMFCDDTDCSQNCGQSVQVSNPGCLGQNGRQSILFHGGDVGSGDYSLVVSPDGNCPCQDACTTVPTDTLCWDISQYQDAKSFRFISGHCDSNNC
ncbi:hypothetical protein EKO27_g4550 [Xylaria grammica]|uniref:Uncharacterized protein n=1 Tax=Xylaria grammica TaxID=363999 RepID=A0A439D814_9PEZI|nr:hypothetical protein F5X98DRAFT_45490 [Xylaria grammica]RWA10543.1 hypothetical protein EKO27_g4550 [Xylaria grammica]GAW13591.1 hypothetical protein ANO14919_029780 [Xylariales sp. No.14919]